MVHDDIAALLTCWGQALATKDPKVVTELYAEDAVLIPTVSNDIRYTQEERIDYFTLFLALEPELTLNDSVIRIFGDIAIHSGTYSFSLKDNQTAKARFTFVYRNDANIWKIIEHHSSFMPE